MNGLAAPTADVLMTVDDPLVAENVVVAVAVTINDHTTIESAMTISDERSLWLAMTHAP
jgi:hypothetical protein